MTVSAIILSPDQWMYQLFTAKAAQRGGIIRRSTRDVERLVGRPLFLRELERRGFHAVENSGQFVIFCNNEPVKTLC